MPEIILECPLDLQGQTIDRLTIRRPKVRDLKRLDKVKGDVQKMVTLVCDLTNPPLTPENVEDMDAGDMAKISQLLESFFPKAAPPDET